MDFKEGIPTKRDHLFDGANYASWSMIMKTYLIDLGFGIWELVTIGFTDEVGKDSSKHNAK
jgi:hypothetical protein